MAVTARHLSEQSGVPVSCVHATQTDAGIEEEDFANALVSSCLGRAVAMLYNGTAKDRPNVHAPRALSEE